VKAPPFSDRYHAGASLAAKLADLTPPPAVIGAIPLGGVIVATPIAALLGLPLALIHALELTAPPAPELVFGAVDEEGHTVVDYPLIAALRLNDEDVESIKRRLVRELQLRRRRYGGRPLADFLPAERVVLIDDGLATGLTMDAAVAYARRHGAQEVVVAVPCASSQAAARLQGSADHFLALAVDPGFEAVSHYYASFDPASEQDVLRAVSRLGLTPASPRT
jgi:predicted phosphoribosyltransferase